MNVPSQTPTHPARPLHIALLVHSFFPEHFYGTEHYTRSLARQFRAMGHRATVVTARAAGEPGQPALVDAFAFEGIPVFRIDRNRVPARNARETYDHAALDAVFGDLLAQLAPDVVHLCHLDNLTTACIRATAALGLPVFATLTDFYNLCLTGSLETTDGALCAGPSPSRDTCMACGISIMAQQQPSALWRTLAHPRVRDPAARVATTIPAYLPQPLRRDAQAVIDRPEVLREAMTHYRAAIAPTAFLKQAFEANHCPMPIDLSPFGIDIDRAPKPLTAETRLRVGFIGQLAAYKGPHLLLQALKTIAPERYTLDLWGSEALAPAYARDLRRRAETMPVTFRGTFAEPDAAAVLSSLDILVMPSTWVENSPLTLLKALATHTPVIASDVEGMSEFLVEGANGFTFPRGDVDALAAILQRLVDDPATARRMSLTTHYERTEHTMADEVLRLYRRFGVG